MTQPPSRSKKLRTPKVIGRTEAIATVLDAGLSNLVAVVVDADVVAMVDDVRAHRRSPSFCLISATTPASSAKTIPPSARGIAPVLSRPSP